MSIEKQEARQTIASFGKKALLEHIMEKFTVTGDSSLHGCEEEAAVALYQEPLSVSAQNLFLEGIDFDLSYFPLKFLGYKAVVAALAKVAAMNALPRQILVQVGLSQRFFVSDVDELFAGISIACRHFEADLSGLTIKSSYTGLTLAVTALGEASQSGLCTCSGANNTDLICLSGNVGAAYMGLQVLEREKKVFEGQTDKDEMPQLKGYEYLLEQYMKPEYPAELLKNLRADEILPSAMALVNEGLASAILKICHASNCGAKIFLDKIPIAKECFDFEKESETKDPEGNTIDSIVAALSGGEDYQIIFTIPIAQYEKISKDYNLDIIGHICSTDTGCRLISPNGPNVNLEGMGF